MFHRAQSVFAGHAPAELDAVFHDLRAEGAFLVSASRKNGKTEWIRIESLAGETDNLKEYSHAARSKP